MTKLLLLLTAIAGCSVSHPDTDALSDLGPTSVADTDLYEPVIVEVEDISAATESLELDLDPDPVLDLPLPATTFRLRRGETLAHFARWAELPVEAVAELSGLDLGGSYPVGTEVRLPVSGERLSRVEQRRDAHHLRRVEGYLASRGGALGSEFHQVRTGETAWSIAHESQGIPVWVLEAYNPATNLDALHPGDQLMVPIIADIVVDAEPEDLPAGP